MSIALSLDHSKRTTAVYARVSTLHQSTGLDAQIRALRDWCAQNKIVNYSIYQDEGISGAKDSRHSLDRMMVDVEAGKVERVVVYSFSRYARSTTHLMKALKKFKEDDVSFVSITERIDTESPIGAAMFTVISAISQLERDLIVERVKNGLKAAKARDIQIGRKKTRPSELIRRLRSKGLAFREISRIEGCSQGAISAELVEWRKEKEDGINKMLGHDIPALPLQENSDPIPQSKNTLEIIRY
jgi:DNA invertase Pin-like site-specific DNA recombinase